MSYRFISAIIILALAVMACGFNISLPKVPTPGPDQTDEMSVPAVSPTSSVITHLTLSFGAGDLTLNPGAKNLLEGTATYNLPDLKPEVVGGGENVEVKEGDLKSIPNPSGIKNVWDFKLGATPMDLSINAGAYKGTYELGGLALTGLTIKDGASNVDLSFSKPNQTQMTVFRYETGASNVKLTGLANANFGTMIFNSGAGDYTLDFSGTLKRDAAITVSSGISNLILVIPDGVNANVTVESGVSNVSAGPKWMQHGNIYSQSGSGPMLTFIVKTGAGNLTLTH
ncbi:MAG TPA: toast rack family protein [Methylomirabilota bacterium]|nr:toast rack family protein [Methylomirabilota bacterium]